MSYFYVFLTVLLTVFGQIVIKWQVLLAGSMPADFSAKLIFLLKLCLNPWIIMAFGGAFIAALSWMAAMAKLPLSVAYPYCSLSFVLVMICSYLFFNEIITIYKLAGISLIILGIVVGNYE